MVGREYKWYVLYTRSQHEKQLDRDFGRLCIESYLPLAPSIRFWSDRKKIVDMPLFPNYLFVRASCREYTFILEHPSVLGFVKTGKEPSGVPDSTIEILKMALNERMELVRCCEAPVKGRQVSIINGPLTGFEGEVIECYGKNYLLIEINQICQRIMVRINAESVIIIEEKPKPCTLNFVT